MVAIGPLVEILTEPQCLGQALGKGSPLERFVRLGGKVLLLGAPLASVTALHYAEAIANIPGKRRVTYEMPLLGPDGQTIWELTEDFDSNGILDCFAVDGQPDAVETIARAYIALERHQIGRVGDAFSYLFDAQDIVSFGVLARGHRHKFGPAQKSVRTTSSNDVAKASTAPESTPGMASGRVIRRNTVAGEAPRLWAASSTRSRSPPQKALPRLCGR